MAASSSTMASEITTTNMTHAFQTLGLEPIADRGLVTQAAVCMKRRFHLPELWGASQEYHAMSQQIEKAYAYLHQLSDKELVQGVHDLEKSALSFGFINSNKLLAMLSSEPSSAPSQIELIHLGDANTLLAHYVSFRLHSMNPLASFISRGISDLKLGRPVAYKLFNDAISQASFRQGGDASYNEVSIVYGLDPTTAKIMTMDVLLDLSGGLACKSIPISLPLFSNDNELKFIAECFNAIEVSARERLSLNRVDHSYIFALEDFMHNFLKLKCHINSKRYNSEIFIAYLNNFDDICKIEEIKHAKELFNLEFNVHFDSYNEKIATEKISEYERFIEKISTNYVYYQFFIGSDLKRIVGGDLLQQDDHEIYGGENSKESLFAKFFPDEYQKFKVDFIDLVRYREQSFFGFSIAMGSKNPAATNTFKVLTELQDVLCSSLEKTEISSLHLGS